MGVFKGYQPNIFRAVSGSLFSTAANWSRGYVPTGSDVATIADNCVIDITRTIGSLVVRSPFTASISGAITLQVRDIINSLGHISCSGAPTIFVTSNKNVISSLSAGASTFHFSSSIYDQTIPGVTYNNVLIGGSRVKRLSGNTNISGNLTISSGPNANFTGGGIIDAYIHDLTVSGSTIVNLSGAMFRKSGPGRLTFIGNIAGSDGNGSRFDLIGNPIVEFRNGIVIQFYANNGYFDSGQGQWLFTTNNQNIEPRYATYNNRNTTLISGSIDVTVLGGSARSPIILSGLTNGTTASSRLINSGAIYLNYAPSPIPMSIGSFIYNAVPSSRLGFVFDGNYQLPYSSYPNLTIGGGGTKSLPAISSSVSASSLNFIAINNGPSTFDISASNFYCGPINISAGSPGPTLTKTRSGNVTIEGDIFIAQSTLDFRGGNPSVTFTGNLTNGANEIRGFFSGTGSWYFPSVTQSVTMPYVNLHWGGPLLISGTLKFDSALQAVNNFISGSINGTNSSAKLINSGTLIFVTENSISSSFLTGSPDFTFPGNSVVIGGDYTATIPTKYSSSFYNLIISGLGTKSLASDTYISGNLSLSSFGLFDVSSSNLTVNGTTNVGGSGGIIRKSGPGKITFIGKLTTHPNQMDFTTGNPSLEFQNGLQSISSGGNLNFGSGTCSFTSNNQTIDISSFGDQRATFKNILVSGSIAVTASGATYGWAYIHVSEGINGTNPNSIFTPRTTVGSTPVIWYSGSQMPMQIGILDVSSSVNTFIYASGSQDVKGGTYRNLTFLNGLKTLQGNVSVLGTFSTGSGATSGSYNLNGFTLTNP